jgi:putative SOS response-associated peptidase YedK
VWFALNEYRPLFAFAGIWTEFKGDPDDGTERNGRADPPQACR